MSSTLQPDRELFEREVDLLENCEVYDLRPCTAHLVYHRAQNTHRIVTYRCPFCLIPRSEWVIPELHKHLGECEEVPG